MTDDRRRLARVFGFEPMKPWGPVAGIGVTAIVPALWIIGGGLAVGVVAILVDENRKIADGLREVERWGFPVTGYREWLLAATPAFDIEMRRDVSVDLLAGSLQAIDPSIAITRRSERIARVVMRRVELQGPERSPSLLVGDRTRLVEIRDRVLAPLHADVGIVALRMGDAESLAALAPVASSGGEAAFRDQAIHAPPDLQSLAHAGTAHLAPPQEASSVRLRTDRLMFALGMVPATAGQLTGLLLGLVVVGGIAASLVATAGVGFLAGGGAGSLAAWGRRRSDRRRLDDELQRFTKRAFPIDGFENWLLSGRPQFDIELERADDAARLERALKGAVDDAHLERITRTAPDNVTLTWLTDVIVRVETEPSIHMAGNGIKSFWGGNPHAFEYMLALFEKEKLAIRAVRMGGYLDRRA